MPKSISFARAAPAGSGWSAGRTTTFWGLMSRWMTPLACAWSSASQSSAPISRHVAVGDPARSRQLVERLALDQLADQVGVAAVLAELVERDDPAVVEPRRRLGLAQHPAARLAADLDHLDRDVALEALVPGAVDGAEAPGAEPLEQREPAENRVLTHRASCFATPGRRSCPPRARSGTRSDAPPCPWGRGHTSDAESPSRRRRLAFLDEDDPFSPDQTERGRPAAGSARSRPPDPGAAADRRRRRDR